MRTSTAPAGDNKVTLTVELDESDVAQALDASVRRLSREIRVPGFRPGKVPRKVIEARLGGPGVLREEAIRSSLSEFYAQAVADSGADVIDAPSIDITSGLEDGPVVFDATVEVRPKVSVAGYAGLVVTVPPLEVTDEEVDARIDRMRETDGQLVAVERPAAARDRLTITLEAREADPDEGEEPQVLARLDDYVYELGSGTVFPEMDDALEGATAGSEHAFRAGSVVGDRAADVTVTVSGVQELVLPEVTDEWASEASEFATVAELRDDVAKRLATLKRLQARLAVRDGAVEALVALVTEPVPDVLVSAEMRRQLTDLQRRLQQQGMTLDQYVAATGQDADAFFDQLRAAGESSVRLDLALRSLADAEGLDVGDDELDEEIRAAAEQTGQRPADLRARLTSSGAVADLVSDLRKNRAMTWLVEHVSLVDPEGNTVERDALEEPGGDGEPDETAAGSPDQDAEEESR